MRRRLLPLLLSALCAATAQAGPTETSGEAAWTPPKSALAPALRDPSYPLADVAATNFPAIDPARIDAVRFDNSAPLVKLMKIGVEREARLEAKARSSELKWRSTPDGGLVAQLQARSPGAVALRTALDVTQLPEGAEVRFQGSDEPFVVGAAEIEKLRAEQPRYWSPITEGDTQTIEVWLPAGANPQWARLSLDAVSHLFVSPSGDLAGAKIGESDDCEYDTKCLENPSQAILSAKNAVARMAFQVGDATGLCTGTLLNDTDANTQVPHFYGAAHCFTSQSVANTLTTFWFYEATGCGSGVVDSATRQVSGGATIEYANTSADVLLVRLNNAPPAGAYYLGWNSAQIANGTEIAVLHHPAGDVKKVSFGAVKGFGASNLASGQFIKVGYTDGTTEGGSSGCGLLALGSNGELQLRGGLLGGTAGCANTGNVGTAANTDDFSRFDLAFPNLQAYLAPTPSGPPAGTDFTGIYNNPDQSGWGLAVLRGASGTYAVNLYHYDQDNKTAWYLSTGQVNNNAFNSALVALTGPWFGTVPYNPSQVAVRQAGNITLQFTSATAANVSFTIDGRTVTTTVRKLAF
jgi:lysyl endopeptidase